MSTESAKMKPGSKITGKKRNESMYSVGTEDAGGSLMKKAKTKTSHDKSKKRARKVVRHDGYEMMVNIDSCQQPTTSNDQLKNEIEELKKKLAVVTHVLVKSNIVSSSTLDSFPQTKQIVSKSFSYHSPGQCVETSLQGSPPFTTPPPTSVHAAKSTSVNPTSSTDPVLPNAHQKAAAISKEIELVEGYGVYLTRRQLDEAVDQSCNSATRLIRNLLMVFFSPSILAKSSCLGTGKFPALNRDIVTACIKFTRDKFPSTTRSCLVDAVNDKCANYRRKNKKV